MMRTLVANMKRAFRDRETISIGGGEFYPEDMKNAACLIETALDLVPLLDRAGVINLYIADSPEHLKLLTGDRLELSEKLRALVELSKTI